MIIAAGGHSISMCNYDDGSDAGRGASLCQGADICGSLVLAHTGLEQPHGMTVIVCGNNRLVCLLAVDSTEAVREGLGRNLTNSTRFLK